MPADEGKISPGGGTNGGHTPVSAATSEVALDLAAPGRRIHVVGVGGAGMSAIATVLAAMGHRVSGSDQVASARLDRLAALGIEVSVGHAAGHVGDVEAVTYSTAVAPGNPELVAARSRGIPLLSRADVLAAIAATRRTVAVAGTHGKTTTASMLAACLAGSGLHPSWVIGGELHGLGGGARWDPAGDVLVVEADESDGTFLALPADVAVVTSVEPDHLEHYGGFAALESAFDRFLAQAASARVACADDRLAAALGREHGAATYGEAADADYRITGLALDGHGSRFTVERGGAALADVEVPVAGRHNALNACGALVAALTVGAAAGDAARALAGFAGVARRFQLRGEAAGVTYVDDYAHLPTEVAAALSAARDGRWRRVVCVFQPHRYSRTQALADDFAHAFDGADVLAVTDVYGAGEAPRPGVSGKLVVDAVLHVGPARRVAWLPRREHLVTYLRRTLRPGDLCLTLGAGDLTTLPDELLAAGPEGHTGVAS